MVAAGDTAPAGEGAGDAAAVVDLEGALLQPTTDARDNAARMGINAEHLNT